MITQVIAVLILAYLLGSFPFGLIIVRIINGEDIRKIKSGRTGGTNAMRAAGFWAGLVTAILDIAKGYFGVIIARSIMPGNTWIEIFGGLITIVGHNYSIFLIERDQGGKLRFRGGAGGATTVGGAIALWPPLIIILVPVAALILFGVGYASVTTMSIPIISIVVLSFRAYLGYSPWSYILYGIIAEFIILWALRPNIERLCNGTERLVGWRANRKKQEPKTNNSRSHYSENPIKN